MVLSTILREQGYLRGEASRARYKALSTYRAWPRRRRCFDIRGAEGGWGVERRRGLYFTMRENAALEVP